MLNQLQTKIIINKKKINNYYALLLFSYNFILLSFIPSPHVGPQI